MKSTPTARLRRLLIAVAYLTLAGNASMQAAVVQISPEIQATVAEQGRVRVIVMFRQAQDRSFDTALPDKARIANIRTAREQILAELSSQVISRRSFFLIPAFATEVDLQTLKLLQSHPMVERIDLDLPGAAQMAEGGPLAGIPQAFASGMTGAGAKVAIVDSGIDLDHPDFAGRILGQQCFCRVLGGSGCCPNGTGEQSGPGSAEDGNGHGTNVAGITAGGGALALRGGAPSAAIVAVRVMDDNGIFNYVSDVIAGFDWVRANHPDAGVLIAGLGTFSLYDTPCDEAHIAMTEAVNNLITNNTMVIVPSGNDGSGTKMSLPACISTSFSVGAVYDAPRAKSQWDHCTDNDIVALKPVCFTNSHEQLDLYAPGVAITSSGIDGILELSGTSQAASMVAGCAVALRAWSPASPIALIEAALKDSPGSVIDLKNFLEFPLLDCLDARNKIEHGLLCHALTGTHTGSGLDPSASPGNSSACAHGMYLSDELIELTASPGNLWRVGSWSGTNDNRSFSTINQTTMPLNDHTVLVNYVEDIPPGGGIETLFVPIMPCRLLDTRAPSGGGPFGAETTREFQASGLLESQGGSNECEIPDDAVAVHMNFTAVNPGGFGYLRTWPFGEDEPLATLMAFTAGPGVSNATALAVCDQCSMDFYVKIYQSATDLVVDAVGYYVPIMPPVPEPQESPD